MPGTRAFLALDFDDAFLDAAEALAAEVGTGIQGVKWLARPLMHLTLRFFAALEAPIASAIVARIPDLGAGRCGVGVEARRLVAFPDARRARVLAVDVDAPPLVELVAATEAMLAELGVPAEPRPFHAHVTIGRLRQPADLRGLVERRSIALSGTVTAITLYESKLGQAGPTYTVLAQAKL
jgi:2'-5' RNA ligase